MHTVKSYCLENKLSTQIFHKNHKSQRHNPEQEKLADSKGDTLTLFRQGKTVLEIAGIRSLTPGTIEGHLTWFIRTGKLDVHDLLTREKIQVIMKELKQMEGNSMARLKEILGNGYSYGEIRAVIGYLQWMKEAGIEI